MNYENTAFRPLNLLLEGKVVIGALRFLWLILQCERN